MICFGTEEEATNGVLIFLILCHGGGLQAIVAYGNIHHRVQRFILKKQLTTYRLLQRFYTDGQVTW